MKHWYVLSVSKCQGVTGNTFLPKVVLKILITILENIISMSPLVLHNSERIGLLQTKSSISFMNIKPTQFYFFGELC